MIIAQIALPVPLDKTFDYLISSNEVACVGARARVPFGHRELVGIITQLNNHSELPSKQLKTVIEILDSTALLPETLWQTVLWGARYYQHPLGDALLSSLPKLLRQGKAAKIAETLSWQITDLGRQQELSSLKRAFKQQSALTVLQKINSIPHYQLKEWEITLPIMQVLQKKALVSLVENVPDSTSWQATITIYPSELQLNREQSFAVEQIRQQSHFFTIWLLQGVTGSGKTEVYFNALEHCLQQGKQILVLIPEINLTPQTVARFRQRFSVPIEALHSGLNDSERLAVWLKAKQGSIAIVIGTRSAIFTPFQNLGMIIIDEEHDLSYKQQTAWRYHARDIAIIRAQKENIPIILGSATPSFETLHNVSIQKYRLLELTERAGNAKPVKQHIIDLKGVRTHSGLSPSLLRRIEKHLLAQNQVILFLNQRGYAPVLMCHECSWIAECSRCDSYFTLHQGQKIISCHHCGSSRPIIQQCPECGSTQLLPLGVGTEQLEAALREHFPNLPITRIDRDTTARKGTLEHHLEEIHQPGPRLLIGTQMLAKGHHFPNVTLVGLIDVDGALFSADFRAAERFAQLYTQISGRAGRAEKAGEVLLQTHHPEHPMLQNLLQNGYNAFASQALASRKIAQLPPYSYHALFLAEDYDSSKAQNFLRQVQEILSKKEAETESFWILGPILALKAKRQGRFRWQLLLQNRSRKPLLQLLSNTKEAISSLPLGKKVRWSLDIDPIES